LSQFPPDEQPPRILFPWFCDTIDLMPALGVLGMFHPPVGSVRFLDSFFRLYGWLILSVIVSDFVLDKKFLYLGLCHSFSRLRLFRPPRNVLKIFSHFLFSPPPPPRLSNWLHRLLSRLRGEAPQRLRPLWSQRFFGIFGCVAPARAFAFFLDGCQALNPTLPPQNQRSIFLTTKQVCIRTSPSRLLRGYLCLSVFVATVIGSLSRFSLFFWIAS